MHQERGRRTNGFHVLLWSDREETSAAAGLQFEKMEGRMASWLLNKYNQYFIWKGRVQTDGNLWVRQCH